MARMKSAVTRLFRVLSSLTGEAFLSFPIAEAQGSEVFSSCDISKSPQSESLSGATQHLISLLPPPEE